MRKEHLILLCSVLFLHSCSVNRTLIERQRNQHGSLKFYTEVDLKEDRHRKKLVAKVNNSAYYSFYPDKIVKHTREEKQLIYTLFFEQIPKEMDDPKYYQKLSAIDSLVLSKGDRILDSLQWQNYQRPHGASAFQIEVNFYHGYPKNEKFRPY
ncbi:hypothetical protein V6B16_09365 [Salinimicrobium catena]|uniref:hypothetical protein n=1 Tax=Salinimicrobium catena TaxID=390640 RepID=UPI002FE46442